MSVIYKTAIKYMLHQDSPVNTCREVQSSRTYILNCTYVEHCQYLYYIHIIY